MTDNLIDAAREAVEVLWFSAGFVDYVEGLEGELIALADRLERAIEEQPERRCETCRWCGEADPATERRSCGHHGGWWARDEGCTRHEKKQP